MVSGYGDSFDYTFYARKSVLDGTVKDGDFDVYNASSFTKASGGLQFNLFGSSAKGVVHSTVTPPKLKELPPTPLITPVPDVISKPEIHLITKFTWHKIDRFF